LVFDSALAPLAPEGIIAFDEFEFPNFFTFAFIGSDWLSLFYAVDALVVNEFVVDMLRAGTLPKAGSLVT